MEERKYKTPEAVRARSKARAERLKAAGLCVSCGKRPAKEGRKQCASCLAVHVIGEQLRQDALRRNHQCRSCAGKLPDGYYYDECLVCRRKHLQARNERNERRRQAHQCIKCVTQLPDGYPYKYCPDCRAYFNAKRNKGGS